MNTATRSEWSPGSAPVAVVMISLNEGHNMEAVLANLAGWASEVFLVDSYSKDETVDIALRHGVHVVQRRFRDFGDQWNFALRELPITSPWTMKLDPDERLDTRLKESLRTLIERNEADTVGISVMRRLWFMGRRIGVSQRLLRVWRTGAARFTDVIVNEHPVVDGRIVDAAGELIHYDSPDLDHWFEKQNRYSTAEALTAYRNSALAARPRLFGTAFERRMWIKRHFDSIPFGSLGLFLYYWIGQGAWRAGDVGRIWSRLRCDVMRFRRYKRVEMEITGREPRPVPRGSGVPDSRVPQFE